MAKTLKKITKPLVSKRFLTRTQAIRKLQIKLNDFRHLCILKGIFPKEPPKFFKGVNKTYYAKEDINFLANEKILEKFRQIKAYQKKITKAKKKRMKFDAQKLIENKPFYTIHHIIKERYPKFVDTLNDMGDALCLISIFSTLPKYSLLHISQEKVLLSQRLLREFFFYCTVAQNIKKSFISIKGIYVQIEIQGEKITWLTPFSHPQKLTYDVDYEIMNDFLELYTELMKFVNFRLFKDIGMTYPLPEENWDLKFFGFSSVEIKSLQSKFSQSSPQIPQDININSEEWKKIKEKEEEKHKLHSLFNGLIFYVGREVPREICEMIIGSCGGMFGDDSEESAFNEEDKRITHYVVDRPKEGIKMKKNKEYVQPQWIFDCLNKCQLLPVSEYAPGKKLPPHLSPFYSLDEQGEYLTENDVETQEKKEVKKTKETPEITKEDLQLREMILSNNKKKILKKIREEELKKKKQRIKVDKLK